MTIKYLDSKRISALSSDALVAHLKFNDDVTDSTGSNNGSLIAGTATYVTGKVGNAFSLDGSTRIALANETNFDFERTDPFSVSIWVKYPNNTNKMLISKGQDPVSGTPSVPKIGIGIWTQADYINFELGASTQSLRIRISSTGIDDDTWHHLTFTYDGSSSASGARIYVDSALTTPSTVVDTLSSETILNNYAVLIGASGNGTRMFTGVLDDLRIYSRELDQNEVNVIYNGGTGTEGSLRPTNVQDNSILVEKDTGKRYWFDGSTWIWGNPILPTVAGLKLHLDASDSSTITIATGVSQWNDKSGQGNHVTQATGSKQPLLVNSSLNGKAVIRFNGTDEWMSRTSYTGGTLTQPTSIFGVYSWPSGSTTRRVLDSANNSSRHVIYLGSAGQHGIFAGSELLGAGSPNSTDRLQYTALFNTTSSSLRKSKTTILSGTTGTQIMDGIMLAASSGTNSFGDIDIAELLVYNATVSTVDRDAIEDYLTVKWGL
tara:strand:+ start:1208 stop:2677 length:1470 start_codon:yes stop_codon:yes gene_type:complete